MAAAKKSIIDARFGRLVIEGGAADTRSPKGDVIKWVIALCDCGNKKTIRKKALTHKTHPTASCGCLCRERVSAARRIHGEGDEGSYTPEYKAWRAMIQRCVDRNSRTYKRYGALGISVCERWLKGDNGKHPYECFLADMGRKPSPKHSIDRFPDKRGNYEPGNCRWATMKEQERNRGNNRIIEFRGREMCVSELCELTESPYSRTLRRLKSGWPVEEAVNPQKTSRLHQNPLIAEQSL